MPPRLDLSANLGTTCHAAFVISTMFVIPAQPCCMWLQWSLAGTFKFWICTLYSTSREPNSPCIHHVHACIHTDLRIPACKHACIHIRTYIHIYMYMYIYIYTRTYNAMILEALNLLWLLGASPSPRGQRHRVWAPSWSLVLILFIA